MNPSSSSGIESSTALLGVKTVGPRYVKDVLLKSESV